jgi:putative SOS response-associated peptidase YedK
MCSSYTLRTDLSTLKDSFDLQIALDLNPFLEGKRVFPYTDAPVVRLQDDRLALSALQFSLLPAWAKEKRVRFSTHNARLEDFDEKTQERVWIHQKPTWREAFRKRPCVVPIAEFFEPIRRGEHANHMVRFFPEKRSVLWAAGIWEEWISRKDGEIIRSFAILTDDPLPFVQKVGHDRSPVFLRPEAVLGWLEAVDETPEDKIEFLRTHKRFPELAVDRDRPMKSK